MNVRIIVLVMLYTSNLGAMMQEDPLPRSGKLLTEKELPAALAILLKNNPRFAMQCTTYQMDEDKKILAIQGAGPAVKIYTHADGDFTELQELKRSTSPAVHPKGTALAVLKKEKEGVSHSLDYYTFKDDSFVYQTTLLFNQALGEIAFNNDGSRLLVNVLVGTAKYETRQYVKGNSGGLEAIGLKHKATDALVAASHTLKSALNK